ncbi:MAG: response regulator [Candidatus Cloacimonetes bacterium]|nr:response regulator [Candidatus Cloacimonadota bacterium]
MRPILLIDDQKTMIELFSRILIENGYEVVSFIDPVEALTKVIDVNPALILCDYHMPELNGVEVCAKLRGELKYHDGFFLILTNKVRWGEEGDDFHDLPDGWIDKTFDVSKFLEIVSMWYNMVPQ